jgi:catechol 2,3-dioxygenase-like lactoylglutathione lyase family enzyme
MFSHVHLRASNLEESVRFYAAVLEPLGIPKTWDDGKLVEFGELALSADGPATRNAHLAFAASSRAAVEDFHARGLGAGFSSNGAPGYREHYAPDYFAAYLLDPDGNNVEAVWRDPERRSAEGFR